MLNLSVLRYFAFVAGASLAVPAHAGVTINGIGSTPELACWDHDYRANEHARDKTTCYTSCKPDKATFDGTNYRYTSTAPNQRGSCKAKKYDRGYMGHQEFLTRYPKPGSTQTLSSPPAQQPSEEPKWDLVTVSFRCQGNNASMTVSNPTSTPALVNWQTFARDTGYSFPSRVIDAGQAVIAAQSTETRNFHSWRAADWRLVTHSPNRPPMVHPCS